jgi:hypothetical protein
LRIENAKNGRMLEDFRNFLIVDRQPEERTVQRHLLELRMLFDSSGFDPSRLRGRTSGSTRSNSGADPHTAT